MIFGVLTAPKIAKKRNPFRGAIVEPILFLFAFFSNNSKAALIRIQQAKKLRHETLYFHLLHAPPTLSKSYQIKNIKNGTFCLKRTMISVKLMT
jgi:hypothetical protein